MKRETDALTPSLRKKLAGKALLGIQTATWSDSNPRLDPKAKVGGKVGGKTGHQPR